MMMMMMMMLLNVACKWDKTNRQVEIAASEEKESDVLGRALEASSYQNKGAIAAAAGAAGRRSNLEALPTTT